MAYSSTDESSEKWSLVASNSCQFILGMNVRWIVALSRLLQSELQEFSKAAAPAKDTGDAKHGEPRKSGEKFSPFTENLLPLMRIYMAWLYIYRADIVKYQEHLGGHVFDMYRILAQTLTTITKEFQGQQMVASPYLLPEDVTALGMKPFDESGMASVCRLHLAFGKDTFKPHWEDTGLPRNEPDVELRARVYDLMNCGFSLSLDDTFPLAANPPAEGSDGVITVSYVEGGKAAQLVQQEPIGSQPVQADAQVDQLEGQLRNLRPASGTGPAGLSGMQAVGNAGREHIRVPSGSAAIQGSPELPTNDINPLETETDLNLDAKMHNMVDDLLEDDSSDLMGTLSGPGSAAQPKTSSYGMHSATAEQVFGGLQTPGHAPGVVFGKPNPWGSFVSPPQTVPAHGEPAGSQYNERAHFSTGSPNQAQRASSTSSLLPNVPDFTPGLNLQRGSDPFALFPASNVQAPGSQFGQTNFGNPGRPSSGLSGALQGSRGGFGHTRQRLGGSTGSSGASSFFSPRDNAGAYEIASGAHVTGQLHNSRSKTVSSPLGFGMGNSSFSTEFSQNASGLPPVNSPFGLPTGQLNGGFAQGDMYSYNQPFAASFPAYTQPNDLTTVCNGNVYNATTAFGRGVIAAKDDPSHFRNAVKKTHMAAAAAEADAFDRAVLEGALAEDRPRPKG